MSTPTTPNSSTDDQKLKVFVSYAHADNQPFDDGAPCWVSFFIDKLRRSIARQPGGEAIEFWMDPRLEPQRSVNDELRRRIRDSDVIVTLISPRYMASKWCQLEMATFVAEVGGGLSDERVFMVELLPTKREHWHPQVRDLTAVQFWKEDLDNPEPMTLGWPVPDVRGDRDYWREVNTLASRIARRLGELRPEPAPAAETAKTAAAAAITPPADGPLNIVITVDDSDKPLAREAQNLLGELDADAYISLPSNTTNQHPTDHRLGFEAQLHRSHGVIVVYGDSPPEWVHAKFSEVRKVLALHRQGTWTGLLEGPPDQKTEHGLPPRGLMVLNCRQGISKDELSRFVQALRTNQNGAGANGAGRV